jgi:hypothetical protein
MSGDMREAAPPEVSGALTAQCYTIGSRGSTAGSFGRCTANAVLVA